MEDIWHSSVWHVHAQTHSQRMSIWWNFKSACQQLQDLQALAYCSIPEGKRPETPIITHATSSRKEMNLSNNGTCMPNPSDDLVERLTYLKCRLPAVRTS
jgi:hypothetical protein